jgi:glycosyltransferase involved in cell wall biosynthesis
MRVAVATSFDGEIAVCPHARPRVLAAGEREPSARVRVAYVGLASEEKGWAAFAGAARLLREDDRFTFSVIGYVDAKCSRVGLDHVTFYGAYAPTDLGSWLQRVDIAVPAVMRSESYGLIVDECTDAGCFLAIPRLEVLRERIDVRGEGCSYAWYDWGDARGLASVIAEHAEDQ